FLPAGQGFRWDPLASALRPPHLTPGTSRFRCVLQFPPRFCAMPHVPTGLLIPVAILIISLLVIIHEFGHYIVARAFGMRVLTYSIGFGPVIARWRPRGSETVFQIAAIPVLAYVQIAGMNPRDVVDPSDRGS